MMAGFTSRRSPLGHPCIRARRRDAIAPRHPATSANAARAHSDQHQLCSRLVYENNHRAFCMIARNTQLCCVSSANITSLNDNYLATLRTKSKLGQQARNHFRRVPYFENSIGVYKVGLRPLKPVCYCSATIFGARALYASPLPS
jgi:hypothetical protein